MCSRWICLSYWCEPCRLLQARQGKSKPGTVPYEDGGKGWVVGRGGQRQSLKHKVAHKGGVCAAAPLHSLPHDLHRLRALCMS